MGACIQAQDHFGHITSTRQFILVIGKFKGHFTSPKNVLEVKRIYMDIFSIYKNSKWLSTLKETVIMVI